MKLNLHLQGEGWERSGDTYCRGCVLIDQVNISAEQMDEILTKSTDIEGVANTLTALNGHYAIVHRRNDEVYAIVDRVRSIPLFFSYDTSDIFVSNNPDWIQDMLNDHSINETAKREFLLTGYVTDDRTLSTKIRQVRSGEIVRLFLDEEGAPKMERLYYQSYVPNDSMGGDMDLMLKELDAILIKAFQRLVVLAGGRTIVVPLSGGFDSRLIVLMLKRLDYPNVLAFTYGRKGSEEVGVSRKVAEGLGFKWEYVEYSNDKWLKWFHSEEYHDYSRMASNLSTTPAVQDFPAVRELKEMGLIPDNSIIVPGHTVALYDMPAVEGDPNLMDHVLEDILERHYIINGTKVKDPMIREEMIGLITDSLGDLKQYTNRYSAIHSWDFRNRQSKYIVNAVRAYEYLGYSWWLPLEDKELMDFQVKLPSELRNKKVLYKLLVKRLENELLKGGDFPKYEKRTGSKVFNSIFKSISNNKALSKLLERPYYKRRKIKQYHEHPQAYFGMIPLNRYKKEFTGRESINYYIALDYMERLEKRA